MFDRGLRFTFRNLATLFLMVAAIVVPLNLVNTYAFKDVARVRETGAQIEQLDKAILGVDQDRFETAERFDLVVIVVELALLPLLLGAALKVAQDEAASRLPKVSAGLAYGLRHPRVGALLADPGLTISAVVGAGALWFLASRIGGILAEPLYDRAAWAGLGLLRGLAFSVAAPFLLGPLAYRAVAVKGSPPGEPTS